MEERKLYFYFSVNGSYTRKQSSLVSEVKLPRSNKRSKEIKNLGPHLPVHLEIGSKVDLVFEKAKILRGCKRLSIQENPVPKGLYPQFYRGFTVLAFQYERKRFWILWDSAHVLKSN
jgi:hypothetical protein